MNYSFRTVFSEAHEKEIVACMTLGSPGNKGQGRLLNKPEYLHVKYGLLLLCRIWEFDSSVDIKSPCRRVDLELAKLRWRQGTSPHRSLFGCEIAKEGSDRLVFQKIQQINCLLYNCQASSPLAALFFLLTATDCALLPEFL